MFFAIGCYIAPSHSYQKFNFRNLRCSHPCIHHFQACVHFYHIMFSKSPFITYGKIRPNRIIMQLSTIDGPLTSYCGNTTHVHSRTSRRQLIPLALRGAKRNRRICRNKPIKLHLWSAPTLLIRNSLLLYTHASAPIPLTQARLK